MKKLLLLVLIILASGIKGFTQPNCNAPSSGFTPINDLGSGTFKNEWNEVWQGGLYPNGSNYMPEQHKTAGLQMASQVQCLDTNGNPDAANGKIVWLSISLSNTTAETQQFIPLAQKFAGKNPNLILVDGAKGGQSASIISAPWNPNYTAYWSFVNNRLTNAGVTPEQVQVIWLKEADQATNHKNVQGYYDSLVIMFPRILHEIKTRFPNAKLCYMASRISARYASSKLNPEPYSYYTGWAVKKTIEDQINGDPQLQYSGANAKAPWLSWGIYMWSDGSTPQKTNPDIFLTCPTDFQNDGTHPSATGAQKVAGWLLDFFTSDSTATPWFLGSGCPTISGIADENTVLNSVLIFPNPAHQSFNIQFRKEVKSGNILIYDVIGKEIMKIENISGTQINIDCYKLKKGLYIVKISGSNYLLQISKIVIE